QEDHLRAEARGVNVLSGDSSFAPGCEAIASRPDYLTIIRPGFRAIVDYMVDRFEPRFLALSIEVNSYQKRCQSGWHDMVALINDVYDMQKRKLPSLPIFQTFQVEGLWEADGPEKECFDYRKDCLDRNLVPMRDLKTDYFAMSVYPEGSVV